MFLGSHAINMDAKGRLAVPSRVRETMQASCGGRLVITAHTEERCLLIYPEPIWNEKLPIIQALPNMNKAARRTQRLLMGYATPVELDSNGRFLVPPTLRDYASMKKKLMLVGQGNKLELWSESSWVEYLNEGDDADDLTDEMMQISL